MPPAKTTVTRCSVTWKAISTEFASRQPTNFTTVSYSSRIRNERLVCTRSHTLTPAVAHRHISAFVCVCVYVKAIALLVRNDVVLQFNIVFFFLSFYFVLFKPSLLN